MAFVAARNGEETEMMVETVAGLLLMIFMDQVFFARQAIRCQTRRLNEIAMQESRQQQLSQRNDREVAHNPEFLCSGRGQSRLWKIAHKDYCLDTGGSPKVHMADKRGEALKSNWYCVQGMGEGISLPWS